DATTTVLLESAYFEATGIAKTSKRLGLRSEASARFERGVDPNDVATGAARAMELFAEVAGAERRPGVIDVYPQPIERPRIAVRRDRRLIADVLIGAGYDEVYTLPLLAPDDLANAGVAAEGLIEVENPLRSEESILRPSLLPGVLRAVAHNNAHGNPNVALFELGRVFGPPEAGNTLPRERLHLATARAGRFVRTPHEPDRDVSVYDLTAVVEA